MKPHLLLIASIAAGIALPAAADESSDPIDRQVQQVAYAEAVVAPLSQFVSAVSGLEITNDKDGGTVTFRRGEIVSEADYFDSRSFSVTAPLDADSDGSLPATLDSLASSATIEARFSRLWFPPVQDPDGTKSKAFCETLKTKLSAPKAAEMTAEAVRRGIDCDTGLVAKFGSPANVRAFNALRFGPKPLVRMAGISGKLATDTFKYVDAGTATELSVDQRGWSVSAYYAIYRPGKPWLTTFSLNHQDFYEAQKSGTVCAIGGSPCLTGPVGAPKAVTKDIVAVDFRYSDTDFSVSATLQYDSSNDVFAVETPIYLQRGSDGEFNGGIKLNWRSDTNESTASFFIGKAFSLSLPD